ncbi:venom acid phosphatase Acph-1-like isoform X2 [Phymastichus coffea]|nr:venom acid phosphatase Acph-1-like isoform X2 [Phymastichus coffea]XP_058801326.1 venom acid phosphatase Acph-1-like isoform X2 [Phymastichus coffea]
MMQEYNIGKMLRDRYKSFLPDLYRQKDVYAYASDTSRTQASLLLVLAALYPPTNQLKWNNKLDWLPIPIHSNPRRLDILIKSRICPTFGQALHQLLSTKEMLSLLEKHRPVIEKMREVYWKSFNLRDIFCAYNAIKVHKEMNLPMPSWYTDELYSDLNEAKEFYLNALSYTDILKKLNGGPIVRRFLKNMNDTHWKTNKRKIYLYSAHDKTLHAFLKVHDVLDVKQPKYGATIILEKYRGEQNQSYVRFLYWPCGSQEIETITLKTCTEMCPFKNYVEIIKPHLPSDDDMLCLYKNIQPEIMEGIINPDTTIAGVNKNYVV